MSDPPSEDDSNEHNDAKIELLSDSPSKEHFVEHLEKLCDQLTHSEPILAPNLIDPPSLDTLQNLDHLMDNLEHREQIKFESLHFHNL